jgi:hypothetical protein
VVPAQLPGSWQSRGGAQTHPVLRVLVVPDEEDEGRQTPFPLHIPTEHDAPASFGGYEQSVPAGGHVPLW